MIRAYIFRVNIDRVFELRRGVSKESHVSEQLHHYTVAMNEINLLIVGKTEVKSYIPEIARFKNA